MQDIIDKANRLEVMAGDVQKQMDEVRKRIVAEKDQKDAIEQQKVKVSSEKTKVGAEIRACEGKLRGAEQDRADKDEQIRSLREEIQHQNDMAGKLQKEKKGCHEGRQ